MRIVGVTDAVGASGARPVGAEGATAGAEGATAGAEGATAGAEGATAGAEGATAGAEGATAGAEGATAGAEEATAGRPYTLPQRSIGSFVAGFKSAVTRRINAARDAPGAPLWQRSYYEHVIRDEDDYHRIQAYIEDNPRRWAEDEYHPSRTP